MTNKKMTTKNVTFKKLEEGFGHDCGGVSGTMYFGKIKVAEFYADGWSGSIDDIKFFDKKLEQEAIAYQKEHETEDYLQNTEMFIYRAIQNKHMLDSIQADIKKEITKFKNQHSLSAKESIGAFIYLFENSYSYSMFNGLTKEISDEKLNSLKEKAIKNKNYAKAEEVYFLKYVSVRKVMFESIK